MIVMNDDCSPAEKVICHIVGLLHGQNREAYVYLDGVEGRVVVEVRPAGVVAMELPSRIYKGLGNVLKVQLGVIPQENRCELHGNVDVMDARGAVSSVRVKILSYSAGIYLEM